MTNQLLMVDKTGEPQGKPHLTPSHWECSHMLQSGLEPRQWLEKISNQWHCIGPLIYRGWPHSGFEIIMGKRFLSRGNLHTVD